MPIIGAKTSCFTCKKEKVAYQCNGCLEHFCYEHLGVHCQEVKQQLEDLENDRNLFLQTIYDQTTHLQKHVLFEQINRWKDDAIEKIEEIANEAKKSLSQYLCDHLKQLEEKLKILTVDLREMRKENDYNEYHLNELKSRLKAFEEQINQPKNIRIEEDLSSASFIKKIRINILSDQMEQSIHRISSASSLPMLQVRTSISARKSDHSESMSKTDATIHSQWNQYGITVAGGNRNGKELNQLFYPTGLCIDDKQAIYVADEENHRIIKWESEAKYGIVVAGGNDKGNRNDQLNNPTKVILNQKMNALIIADAGNKRVIQCSLETAAKVSIIASNVCCYGLAFDHAGYLYVSDSEKHVVWRSKIGEKKMNIVAGANQLGNRLDQLNSPRSIFVDQEQSIYISDSGNHRIVKWLKNAKQGILVAGGRGQGKKLTQLSYPNGIFVDRLDNIYVADCCNSRIVCWSKQATEGIVIVGDGEQGNQAYQFDGPCDLSFDYKNNLYVVDNTNHRVQKFTIN